jgi:hypothetical protein
MKRIKPVERATDNAAPVVFGIFTGLGVAFIIAAKAWGQSPFIVTTVPVLLMGAYAAMIVLARGLRLRSDQTGDNFYYMGFIFTLVSLGTSLYQYSTGGGVDDIIRNFGVAVASTIAGIILRIMFNQVRRDPIEFEAASRLDLAEASRKVRRELDGIQYEVAHFRRSSQQMAQETFDETRTQLVALGKAAAEAVEAIRASAVTGVEGTAEQISGNFASPEVKRQLDRNSKSLERVNTKLEQATETLANAAEAFANRLVQTQTPDKVVEVTMQPAVDALQKTIAEAFDRMSEQMKSIDRLATEVAKSSAQRDAATADLTRATRSIEELQASIVQQRGGFLGMFGRRDQTRSDETVEQQGGTPRPGGQSQ